MNFLLDTNTVIYLINDRLAMALPAGRYGVSVITEIELLSFPDLRVYEERRIRAFLAVADRVVISEPIRDQAIALRRLHRLNEDPRCHHRRYRHGGECRVVQQ